MQLVKKWATYVISAYWSQTTKHKSVSHMLHISATKKTNVNKVNGSFTYKYVNPYLNPSAMPPNYCYLKLYCYEIKATLVSHLFSYLAKNTYKALRLNTTLVSFTMVSPLSHVSSRNLKHGCIQTKADL